MHTDNQTFDSVQPVTVVPLDEDGFLVEGSLWSRELAESLAELEGLGPLTDRHWRLIDHVRERFQRVGGVSALRLVCRATGIPRDEVKALFGDCRTIWYIAGLPNPGEEARTYF
ncbi:MAG: TusE/DsrC/DsvC family sulfur relay protein [Gammaproteobacteria bacterium]|nr:TusE/DsrC/DsvC family sulfur relay protein [Gammaproteobacteria bacterium]